MSFREIIAALEAEGYANGPAQAKLAHDVVLKALEKCGFGKNITIKGGVVMSAITGDIRRATMDMDIDFVNYSLSNAKIDALVKKRCEDARARFLRRCRSTGTDSHFCDLSSKTFVQ